MNKSSITYIENHIEVIELEGRQLVRALENAQISITEYKKTLDELYTSLKEIKNQLED